MSKSLLSNDKAHCYLTGKYTNNPHKHHIFGGGLRSWSEKEGLWVYLDGTVHHLLHTQDYELELRLKRKGQEVYEQTHSREEFMRHVHKNYLSNARGAVVVVEEFDIAKSKLPWQD